MREGIYFNWSLLVIVKKFLSKFKFFVKNLIFWKFIFENGRRENSDLFKSVIQDQFTKFDTSGLIIWILIFDKCQSYFAFWLNLDHFWTHLKFPTSKTTEVFVQDRYFWISKMEILDDDMRLNFKSDPGQRLRQQNPSTSQTKKKRCFLSRVRH